MMRKQNKGFDFLPMQTRKNSELSIILTSLIFHCKLTRINFCPPRSSTGKWVVLRRELGGNAVDEKSVAVGIGVGYQEDPRWAKKSTPPVRGGFWKTTWAVLYLLKQWRQKWGHEGLVFPLAPFHMVPPHSPNGQRQAFNGLFFKFYDMVRKYDVPILRVNTVMIHP